MPLRFSEQGEMLRPFDGLLAAWRDTNACEERHFLLDFNALLSSVWLVAQLPGLIPARPGQFEQMLDVGAAESAVLKLLAAGSGYMFSRGSNGVHVATVLLAGRETEATASAHTGGLALSGAILVSLSDDGSAQHPRPQVRAISTSH